MKCSQFTIKGKQAPQYDLELDEPNCHIWIVNQTVMDCIRKSSFKKVYETRLMGDRIIGPDND